MVAIINRFGFKAHTDESHTEKLETLDAIGPTQPERYQRSEDGITFQFSGTATEFSGMVERATTDPAGGTPNWAPAEEEVVTGNLTVGVAPRAYHEPGKGWWRFRLIQLVGGVVTVSMMGEQG